MLTLRPFQRRFLSSAFRPEIDTAVLSMPRGNGKSTLAAEVLRRAMTPGDKLHAEGDEVALVAASLEQARMVYRPLRQWLEPAGHYRFIDSITRVGIFCKRTQTRLRVLSSNPKTAMGLVRTRLLVADEPGAWNVVGGQALWDAIDTAQGKPDSPLHVLLIGTLAPSTSGWWHDMVKRGSHGSTHVTLLQGDPDKWDQWPTIQRANPLATHFAPFRRRLLHERDEARRDPRLKARFLSYRLNVPSADESKVLLAVADWKRVCGREVPARQGRPVCGVDLGGGRSWSAAVAIFPNGRMEALAVAPGIPDLSRQEKRDRVPRGTYQQLAAAGQLQVAEGLRVQPPGLLIEAVLRRWGRPRLIVCDRFRLAELQDVAGGVPVQPRRQRWSEAAEDVRALRKLALDGPLSCAQSSRALVGTSLSLAQVKSDDQGSTRLAKEGERRQLARDDVAAAAVLAAGAFVRMGTSPRRSWRFVGVA